MIKKVISTLKGYSYNCINFRLILYVIALTVIGILTIGSATVGENFQSRQIMGLFLGLVAMAFMMLLSYKFILKFYWPLYILTLVLLLAVEFFGKIGLGAERWIIILGIKFQPSEICKIFLILFMAAYIGKYKDRFNTFKVLAPLVVFIAIPLILIFIEPDLSTTIVTFATMCAIIYLAGLHRKIIMSVILVAIPVVGILGYLIFFHPEIEILSPHQYERIFGFYSNDVEDPEIARIKYQQENALLAIGSGGLTGKGLYNDDETSVKNGNFLPECHTDFIFTIVGEELGFVGCIAVIILLLLIIFECFFTGSRSREFSAKLYCYGFGSLIGLQAFVNIAVNTMLLPNTGLTLPFVSYGLTSLVSMFIGVGVVLNVGLQSRKKLY